jgi:hypothetical protein
MREGEGGVCILGGSGARREWDVKSGVRNRNGGREESMIGH